MTLLSNRNLRNYFDDEVVKFLGILFEQFYTTKELVLEELLPFIIEYNCTIRSLVHCISDYPADNLDEDYLLKLYSTNLLLQHKFESELSLETDEIKFFSKENQFFKSQEDLLRKMLAGYKVSKDLHRVKQTAERLKELLKLLKDIKNTRV